MGLTVQFTDHSTGDIAFWLWDFGDGGFSTEQNPLYTYSTYGIFNVTLTVVGAFGGFSRVTHTVSLIWQYCQDMTIDNGGWVAQTTGGNPNAVYVPGVGWQTNVSPFVSTTVQVNFFFPATVLTHVSLQMVSADLSGSGIVNNNMQITFYYPIYDPLHPFDNISGVAQQLYPVPAGGTFSLNKSLASIPAAAMVCALGDGVQGQSLFTLQLAGAEGVDAKLTGNCG